MGAYDREGRPPRKEPDEGVGHPRRCRTLTGQPAVSLPPAYRSLYNLSVTAARAFAPLAALSERVARSGLTSSLNCAKKLDSSRQEKNSRVRKLKDALAELIPNGIRSRDQPGNISDSPVQSGWLNVQFFSLEPLRHDFGQIKVFVLEDILSKVEPTDYDDTLLDLLRTLTRPKSSNSQ
jgi:hypothetical protein